MKKRLIALLLATSVIVSACGSEDEPDEKDSEISESEGDSEDDKSFLEIVKDAENQAVGSEGEVTAQAAATTQVVTATETTEAAADEAATTSPSTESADESNAASQAAPRDTFSTDPIENPSITVEQSDFNSRLLIITNTSNVTYALRTNQCMMFGNSPMDNCFEPGEVLYYYTDVSDGEITKDSFRVYENYSPNIGGDNDIQCSVITATYDASKYDDSKVASLGYGRYYLDDVFQDHLSKVHYLDGTHLSDNIDVYTTLTYFRLFDADGNVIYEPSDASEVYAKTIDIECLNNMDPDIVSGWDHAEFYVITSSAL